MAVVAGPASGLAPYEKWALVASSESCATKCNPARRLVKWIRWKVRPPLPRLVRLRDKVGSPNSSHRQLCLLFPRPR